jgi:TonB family protein
MRRPIEFSLIMLVSLFVLSTSVVASSVAPEPSSKSPLDAPGGAPNDISAGAVAGAAEGTPAPPQVVPPVLTQFKDASLDPELELNPGHYVVSLALTVGEDGAVSDLEVVASDEPLLDAAALTAAGLFRFAPATVDGAPVPVRITYRYSFDISKKEATPVFRFRVREKGKRRLVGGFTAFVEENAATFTSDAEGWLVVKDLPPGTYTLYAPEGDYQELRRPFEVLAEQTSLPEAVIYVDPMSGMSHQTVIRAPREARFVARQSLSIAELKRLPGSGGDVLKMIENLPGIARSPFGGGQLVVFGSHPMDSAVFIDGLPMWQLYHFGGLYSIINPEFIERIDFVPAGFDATYGRAIGGVVDVRLKNEPLDGWHGAFDINVLHAGAIIGAPYSEDGDIQIAFRRSYIDAILNAVLPSDGDLSLTTAPRYYDYQVKLNHRFTPDNRVMVFANGTDDRMVFVTERPAGPDPSFVGDMGFTSWLHTVNARWQLDLAPGLTNELAFHAAIQHFSLNLFGAVSFEFEQIPVLLRDQVDMRLGDTMRLRVGVEAGVIFGIAKVRSPRPPGDSETKVPFSTREILETEEYPVTFLQSVYASLEWKPLPWWTVVPSLRGDVYEGDWNAWNVDPRLSTRVDLSDAFSLHAAGGMFRQFPRMERLSKEFGNPLLPPESSLHSLIGAQWRPLERLSLSTNVFFKWNYDLAESTDTDQRYTSEGEARAYGAEVLLRVDPGGRFFGWIAYTYVVSERWNPDTLYAPPGYEPNPGWQSTDYDQRHLLNMLGSVELGAHWSAGFRFRLATGYPNTPTESAIFDSDADAFSPAPNRDTNSGRMPIFHSLDVRVDKEWLYDTWLLALYLEVQNVYNQQNPEGIMYNYDYTEIDYVYGLPILPVLGIRGEF